jgi:type IV pilus assembly protein PilV
MGTLMSGNCLQAQRGALMIEVLVTIVILAIGLLGLMQTQARLQKSEVESYQRTQALILLNDMASRMATNRSDVASYATELTYLGVGATCPAVGLTLQSEDIREWCLTLQGAAETLAGAGGVGAMVGARGCVEEFTVGREYMVTVVWQGLTPISLPPDTVGCGKNLYDLPAGSDCADNLDYCRRYVTTLVQLASLEPPL